MDYKYFKDENDLEGFEDFEEYYRLRGLDDSDPDEPEELNFERDLGYLQDLDISEDSQGECNEFY